MITITQQGDFSRTINYFRKLEDLDLSKLDIYGQKGVNALRDATPIDSGLTAGSWSYDISKEKNTVTISFKNSNVENGILIAIILQYGHATRNGGWVEGRDYINPAIQPIFDEIVENAWKEVKRL